MSPSLAQLFQAHAYPAMSHPSADPATAFHLATAAGLPAPDPSTARILELGCATGHHLLSLASRWPRASLTGLDLSGKSITRARSLAHRASLSNAHFIESSLIDYQPDHPFDYIIAHGLFSWIPDPQKIHLFDFIGKNLTPHGLAIVSFNVAAGWKKRIPLITKTRALLTAGATDEISALHLLTTISSPEEKPIIADMLAKGPAILAFDDFAPIMDPWSLGAFSKLATHSSLQLIPPLGSDADDEATSKTFRTELLCRAAISLTPTPIPPEKTPPLHPIPAFPKLNPWRMTCVLEGLPVVDSSLIPCTFSIPQLLIMAAMDGTNSHFHLAQHAQKISPDLHFIPFLQHLASRGFFADSQS